MSEKSTLDLLRPRNLPPEHLVFHKCRIVSLRKCHVARDNICSQSQHGYRWIADLDWCKFKADDEWIYGQKKYCITRDDDQPRKAIFVRSYSQKFPITLIQNEPSSLSRRLSFLIICKDKNRQNKFRLPLVKLEIFGEKLCRQAIKIFASRMKQLPAYQTPINKKECVVANVHGKIFLNFMTNFLLISFWWSGMEKNKFKLL